LIGGLKGGETVKESPCYCLSPGVRARKEAFGLLFYNTGDTKLTFVKSGDLFDVSLDPNSRPCLRVGREGVGGDGRVAHTLHILREKGLIIDTPISI
jgi:putative mycofactocin binding protein MftB